MGHPESGSWERVQPRAPSRGGARPSACRWLACPPASTASDRARLPVWAGRQVPGGRAPGAPRFGAGPGNACLEPVSGYCFDAHCGRRRTGARCANHSRRHQPGGRARRRTGPGPRRAAAGRGPGSAARGGRTLSTGGGAATRSQSARQRAASSGICDRGRGEPGGSAPHATHCEPDIRDAGRRIFSTLPSLTKLRSAQKIVSAKNSPSRRASSTRDPGARGTARGRETSARGPVMRNGRSGVRRGPLSLSLLQDLLFQSAAPTLLPYRDRM